MVGKPLAETRNGWLWSNSDFKAIGEPGYKKTAAGLVRLDDCHDIPAALLAAGLSQELVAKSVAHWGRFPQLAHQLEAGYSKSFAEA